MRKKPNTIEVLPVVAQFKNKIKYYEKKKVWYQGRSEQNKWNIVRASLLLFPAL